jgi:hypothetical protein
MAGFYPSAFFPDISIGAVEIKDHDSNIRADVEDNRLRVHEFQNVADFDSLKEATVTGITLGGTDTITAFTVPAGQTWYITYIKLITDSNAKDVYARLNTKIITETQDPSTTGVTTTNTWGGMLIATEGQIIDVTLTNDAATLGNVKVKLFVRR